MKKLIFTLSVLLLTAPAWSASTLTDYKYPINDKYDAT